MSPPVRALVIGGAIQLAASLALLLWASLATSPLPTWPRLVDVALAFSIVATAAALRTQAERVPAAVRVQDYRTAHVVNSTIPSLVVLGAWLLRDGLDWNVLLPGLAWRLFVVLYGMPVVAGVVVGRRERS